MACRMDGTKPLFEPMLEYWNKDYHQMLRELILVDQITPASLLPNNKGRWPL